jgi:NAD(P)-dependent dehydrogenase (short-subunit alcohol dehydrogenase family)
MQRYEGKVALVTGGASGMGRATSKRLASEGARVVLTDRNAAGGAEVAAEIGAQAFFIEQDVTDEAGWKATIEATVKRFGALHLLVNNAGIGGVMGANPENETLEGWQRIQRVNLEGVFLGCKHAIPAIRAAGGGAIVNISSLAAMQGTPALAAYGASKGAVRQFTKTVAMHCAHRRYNIRCNSVHPGPIETAMLDDLMTRGGTTDGAEARRKFIESVPLKMLGKAEDIAAAVAFLGSEDARFITGEELLVDGGMNAI